MQASDILYLIELKSQYQYVFLICETHYICQPCILAKLKPVSTMQALETKFDNPFNSLGQWKTFWCLKLNCCQLLKCRLNKPPTSGIDSFSLREMGDEMQITANARASMNDECGATARIGASSGLLSRPLTLIQWKPMQNSIARPIPRSGFLIILNSLKRNT